MKVLHVNYFENQGGASIAANQIHEIIENHEKNISEYRIKTKECIESYGINNKQNKEKYLKLINELLKK